MYKIGLHDPFEYLQYKLWPEGGAKSQSVNLIPNH
jgi:hypothetical protein